MTQQQIWDCPEARPSLGVYVLGAINPVERGLVDAHLASCQECRDGFAGLAGLPALLARLSPDEVSRISVEDPVRMTSDEPPGGADRHGAGHRQGEAAQRWGIVPRPPPLWCSPSARSPGSSPPRRGLANNQSTNKRLTNKRSRILHAGSVAETPVSDEARTTADQRPTTAPYGSLSTTQSFFPVSTRIISENLRLTWEDPRGVTSTSGKL